MKDSLPSNFNRAALQSELRDLLRPHLRELLRPILHEELRQILADPQSLRALMFPSRPSIATQGHERKSNAAREQAVRTSEAPSLIAALSFAGGTTCTAKFIPLFNSGGCSPLDLTNSSLQQDGSGNIGFGTNTPNATFDIHATNAGMMLSGSGVAFVLADGSWVTQGRFGTETGPSAGPFVSSDVSGNVLKFYMNDGSALNEKMRITSAGKVGIGTSSPTEKLAVSGNAVLSGFLGLAGAPVVDSDSALTGGHIACNLDTTFTDKNQEMRGYEGTLRYTRTTADANEGGAGWDVLSYVGAVSLENMDLPSGDPHIRGQMKPFQSEVYAYKAAPGGPNYTISDVFNYVAALVECDPGVSISSFWAGYIVGPPNDNIGEWVASSTKFLNEMVIPTSISSPNTGSGYIWKATAFSGGAAYGNTGSSEPSWPASPTVGVTTVSDNQITWTCYAAITTALRSVENGYGVWVQNLLDAASTLKSENAAAIKIDGLNEYGRILWNASSLFESASGELNIASTKLAFYDASPVAKQTVTGAKGGNAALASLITALANLGLIADGSS